jgi:heme/copper-type cytochrome/quinol oxidase subunit 2
MTKKPKMGLFAGIKYDWQEWAADKNIIKKIFWFIWLVIWTVVKVVFGILFILFKAFFRAKSKYDANPKNSWN